jgi:hypothetical protein
LKSNGVVFTGTRNNIEYKDGIAINASRADIREADRDAAEAFEASNRAKIEPILNPKIRPTGKIDKNMIIYWSWIGGRTSGKWQQYRRVATQENLEEYGSRVFGGETQATFDSLQGVNALMKQPLPFFVDAPDGKSKRFIGYQLDGTVFTGKGFSTAEEALANTPTDTDTFYFDGSTTRTGIGTGIGTGTGTGTITQADVDFAVNRALTTQIAQQKAEAEAAKLSAKIKAKDKLVNMFAAFDLGDLAGFIDRRIMADASEEQVLLELYDQPEYQKRFPGMAALRKKGKTITEKEYINDEKAFIQTARFFDIPKGFYDSADDFGKLIGNLVSPKEYQDRLQIGQDLARSLNPSIKSQLIDFYGVGEGDLTAFVLDADRALPLIQKQAKAAMFVGIGRAAGFTLGGITASQAENIAGTESYAKLSQAELSKALGTAGVLRSNQQRLAALEGTTYNEQEALSAVIEGSPEALLASQQRAQREAARFSTRGGVTGSSLRSTTTAI